MNMGTSMACFTFPFQSEFHARTSLIPASVDIFAFPQRGTWWNTATMCNIEFMNESRDAANYRICCGYA